MAGDRPSPAGTGLNDPGGARHSDQPSTQATRDIAKVPAVEVITATALHLMSAAAVKVGLAQGAEPDLDEARKQADHRARGTRHRGGSGDRRPARPATPRRATESAAGLP